MSIQGAYFEWLRAALSSVSGALAGLSEVRLVPGTIDASEARAAQVRLAASMAVLDQLLRDVHTAPEPSPPVEPPAPEPPPVEPPAPVPAPPPADLSYEIKSMPVNLAALVFVRQWSPDLSRYTRGQHLLTLQGPKARVQIIGYNMASGGSMRGLLAPEYTLLADGVPMATVRPAGASQAVFEFDADTLPSAVPELTIVPSTPTGETCLPYHAEAIRGGSFGPQDGIPHSTGSYTLAMGQAQYHWGKIHAPYGPVARPLKPRAVLPFSTALPRNRLHVEQIVPLRFGDEYRAAVSAAGCVNTYDDQDYHYFKQVALEPRIPCLDGPRGVGTVSMTTHLQWGRDGKLYGCGPNRVFKIMPDGHITTLAGRRHAHPMPHHQRADFAAAGDLVGDWSEVPEARRGFHELWGLAWDERTLGIIEGAPPPPGETESPHVVGPVAFVADSQRNRVCKLEFSPVTHGPAKVTEFLTGLSDPWDVVCKDGVLYVSERTAHRIAAYDATTGALLRIVVQGSPLALVDKNREVVRLASLDACRAAVCVAPEGLYWHDGWLYFGSKAQAQIRKVRPDGSDLTIHTPHLRTDDNAKFVKFAISDGGFGPVGAIAAAMWSNNTYGWPHTRLPDGSDWGIPNSTPDVSGMNASFVYPSAVALSSYGMAIGGANEGVIVVTQRNPGESLPSAAASRGAAEYRRRGLIQVFGANGFGMTALPLPWGLSDDIDAYLAHCGHSKD